MPISPRRRCPSSRDGRCVLREQWCAVGACEDEHRRRLLLRMQLADGPPWTVPEAARLTGFSQDTILNEIAAGELLSFRLRRGNLPGHHRIRHPRMVDWLRNIGFVERRQDDRRAVARPAPDRRQAPEAPEPPAAATDPLPSDPPKSA